MLAPVNSPREIYASAQLAARDFFGPVDDVERFPRSFVIVRSADGEAAPAPAHRRPFATVVASARDATVQTVGEQGVGRGQDPRVRVGRGRADRDPVLRRSTARPCCASSRSAARLPPRLRPRRPTTRTGSKARRCTTGSTSGKRNVTLNLKQPEAVELVRRLVVEWADAVAENFAPARDEGLRARLRHARRRSSPTS